MSQRELFPRSTPTMGDVEREAAARGLEVIIGVDEAGRGPLAGPVHVAAVAIRVDDAHAEWVSGLNDSKKLTEAQREALYDVVQEGALAYAVVARDRAAIDDVNILQATRQAMKEAVEGVLAQLDEPAQRVYVDGNQYIDIDTPQSAVIKGDGRSFAIAAASILAKVSRDRLMVDLHQTWPEYGFDRHKGYGTKAHRDAIAEHGPCPHHRSSFAGVREHWDRLREEGSEEE